MADLEEKIRVVEESKAKDIFDEEDQQESKFSPVAKQWQNLEHDKAIHLPSLEWSEVENLRSYLYRRFDKEEIIVLSKQKEDGSYFAVVRARNGEEYLSNDS